MNTPTKYQSRWNPEFDFWKFVASVFVLLSHTYTIFGEKVICKHGWLAVELFLLVTGYLFAQSISKDSRPFSAETVPGETWAFLARKFKTLLPFYIVGFLGVYLIKAVQWPQPLNLKAHADALFDFLLLHEQGWTAKQIQGINWYLSCMLAVQFVLYPLLRWRFKVISQWAAPAIGIYLIGWILSTYGTVVPRFDARTSLASVNMYRAFAEICLGVFAWEVTQWLRNRPLHGMRRKLASAVGSISPLFAFVLVAVSVEKWAIPVVLLSFFAFVCLSGAGLSMLSCRLPVSPCKFLGRLSMVLFLTHTTIRVALKLAAKHFSCLHDLFAARDASSIAATLAIYLAFCFVFALGVMFAWDGLSARREVR